MKELVLIIEYTLFGYTFVDTLYCIYCQHSDEAEFDVLDYYYLIVLWMATGVIHLMRM